jgi:hypothetical protein
MTNRLRGRFVYLGVLVATVIGVSACGGGTTQNQPAGSTPGSTSSAPTSQSGDVVPIAKPKKVLKPSECGGLLTVGEVQSAVGFPASAKQSTSRSYCGFEFQETRDFSGLVGVTLGLDDSEPADRVIDVAGNYATERDDPDPAIHECQVRVRVAQVPKEQPGGTLQVRVMFYSAEGKAKDVCAIARGLAKTAFDRIPDA